MLSYRPMRRLAILIVLTGSFLFFGLRPVEASEGTAFLTSDQTGVRCFAASVLLDVDNYQVIVSCRNLIIPPAANRLFYRAWVKRIPASTQAGKAPLGGLIRSEYASIGDLSNGKLTARIRDAFNEVLVTSEAEEQPRSPSLDRIVAIGSMKPLEFGPTPTGTLVSGQPIVQPSPSISPTPTKTPRVTKPGSVVGTAIRVFLVVLGVIVIVAIVISIIQRRSASS